MFLFLLFILFYPNFFTKNQGGSAKRRMDRKPWTRNECLQASTLAILKEWNSGLMFESCAFFSHSDIYFCVCYFTFLLTDPSPLEAFLGGWTVGSSISVGDVRTEGGSDVRK